MTINAVKAIMIAPTKMGRLIIFLSDFSYVNSSEPKARLKPDMVTLEEAFGALFFINSPAESGTTAIENT